MTTYTHVPTGEQRPRHTEYGARTFGVADAVWRVGTQAQLVSALDAAGKGTGGEIHLMDTIVVDRTVRIPSSVYVHGGGIRAANQFTGSHLVEIRGQAKDIQIRDMELDADEVDLIVIPIMEESRNIIIERCSVHDGRQGITISGGSSDITVAECRSYGHSTWHGIVVQHTDCSSIAILGCAFYDNAAYGIDLHGTDIEVAGCEVYENGRNTDTYSGAGTKYPEVRNLWFHDNDVRNSGDGYGCFWTYGDPAKNERQPRDVRAYRNLFIGGPHYRVHENCTVTVCDNVCMTANGDIVSPHLAGGGRMVEDVSLRSLPTEVEDDKTTPVDPPPTSITAEEAELIAEQVAMDVFAREFSKMRVVYDPAATPPGMMNKPGRRDARHWAGDSD